MKKIALPKLGVILLLAICMASIAVQAQDTSTPEERARVVAITQKLEQSPLDKGLKNDRDWAIKRMIEVKDIHVPLCPGILGDGYFSSGYKYKNEITAQLLLASASFVIENQGKTWEQTALDQSALESVLKTYRAILQVKPKDKSKELDLLVQKQDAGQIPEYLQSADKNCGTKQQ